MELIFNPDCLSYEEIEKFVSRVKILIINDFNQLLLCKIDGPYYFIGGHIEEKLLSSVSTPEQESLVNKMIEVISYFKIKPKLLRKKLNGGCYE